MAKPLLCPADLLSQDLTGKFYIVTGGNSGIGRVTVGQLAKQGARVVLACRRVAEGERVKAALVGAGVAGAIEVMELDLADLGSVRSFAASYLSSHTVLHGLINNAGVMNTPAGKTKDGFETQLGTNHLGHFLLTELLLGVLRSSAPSRIVNLSSCFHDVANGRKGAIGFDDLHFDQRKYDGWEAYAQSKLANLLYAKELAGRLSGTGVTAVSVHPGWVRTELVKSFMPVWLQNTVLRPFLKLGGMIEPWEGAQATLFAVLSPVVPEHSGAFFSQLGTYRDKSASGGGWPMRSPNPNAHDDESAKRLTAVSRALVGLTT